MTAIAGSSEPPVTSTADIFFCPKSLGISFWKLPNPIDCQQLPSESQPLCIRPRKVHFFSRTAAHSVTNATHCACVITEVSFVHGLFRMFSGQKPYVSYSTRQELVSEMQCHQMLKWKESPAGKLMWDGVSWKTNHSIELDSPGSIFH